VAPALVGRDRRAVSETSDPDAVPHLDAVLSDAGWPYASSEPVAPEDPGRFHALFGRDALVTALALLPVRPDVARATLRVLAALQGRTEDPANDEEPGKIVHEYRPRAPASMVERGWPVRDGAIRYYGSADGTSWFLVVLASLEDRALEAELEGAWRAAGAWLTRVLARGSGLVRHGPRQYRGGLRIQGWRDAQDPPSGRGGGIVLEDRSFPEAPLADADSQAVALVALRAMAALSGLAVWEERAALLAEAIEARFDPETMALAAGDRPVTGAGSQLGWLLWADALSPPARERFASRLCEPDVLTGFGLRTLSSEHPAYYAEGYHRGAVWPFDSWLGWGGLRAAGRLEAAERVRTGVLEAVKRIGRYPELYAVTEDGPQPIAISNFVQAWTVGAVWALRHEWDGGARVVA
jgi:glycogen debranching enzyme